MTAPKTPPGLNAAGRRLWRDALADYEFDTHEELLFLRRAGAPTASTGSP